MKPSEEVRSKVDIVKIIGDYVKLRKSGANFTGLCPFHQEKSPSFAVHPVKQIFHCFGCGVGGDVFKFIMLIENLTFPEALERVAEKAGIELSGRWAAEHHDADARTRAALHRIHELAAQFFAAQLGATAEGRAARAYLGDRGLTDEDVARFRLGYAPAGGRELARRLAEEGLSREVIHASGLVAPGHEPDSSPYDRFRRRVIFPIANESGKIVAFAGRSLTDEPPKYLNSPETPIYAKSRILYHLHRAGASIRKLDYAVLVEGYMDAIALASRGVENVVASCGTSLTESQVRLLGRYTRRVVVNYDPDSAGKAATERSLGLLLEEGFEVKVLTLPEGIDPDSFIRKQGVAAYRERLAKAPAYLDYLTDGAAATHDLTTPEGKVRAVNFVLPYLIKVPSPLLRDEMAARLAARLRVDEKLLRKELKRAAQSGAPAITLATPATPSPMSPAEKEVLRAFLASPELAAEFLPILNREKCCEGRPISGIIEKLLAEIQRSGKLDLAELQGLLPQEDYRLLVEVQFLEGAVPDRERTLAAVDALRRRRMDRERATLQAAIERAERQQDQAELNRLMQAKVQLAKNLALRGRRENSFPST
ncbi:MAG: DNA primase [Terriglobia bacterium]